MIKVTAWEDQLRKMKQRITLRMKEDKIRKNAGRISAVESDSPNARKLAFFHII